MKWNKQLLVALTTVVLVISSITALAIFSIGTPRIQAWKLHPNLIAAMEETEGNQGRITAIAHVEWNPDFTDIMYQLGPVKAMLKAEAEATQAPVIQWLEENNAYVMNTFWLTNIILFTASEQTVYDLTTLSQVDWVVDNFEVTIEDPIEAQQVYPGWQLDNVNVKPVWEELGITGTEVRVATTDTGVHIEHPDLAGKLWTDDPSDPTYPGGWIEYDCAGNIIPGSVPHDSWIHGTGASSLVVGGAASGVNIGMAYDAILMHALSLPGGGGCFPQVAAGLQWVIDPVDQFGNPAGEPARVSSHSWGAFGYHDELIEPIQMMWMAGHVVVASTGNDGQGTSSTPGNIYETIGAGATDINDNVVGFSSGEIVCKSDWASPPADWPECWVVPDLSAPGLNVYMALPPNSWHYWSGTSFSSPLIGGLFTLMVAANPSLTPEEYLDWAIAGADWWPNYAAEPPDIRYGWGRINAFESVLPIAFKQGIYGTVTDADTGSPISQATVSIPDLGRSVQTKKDGTYEIRIPEGTYDVGFSHFLYISETVTGVEVPPEVFVELNVDLEMAPTGIITGAVNFDPSGIGIPGVLVDVLDIPVTIRGETDWDGVYSVTLPAGAYDIQSRLEGFDCTGATGLSVVAYTTITANLICSKLPKAAVLGDYGGQLAGQLATTGLTVDERGWDFVAAGDVGKYDLVVLGEATGYPGCGVFMDLLNQADAAGTGVMFLDNWGGYFSSGIWLKSWCTGVPTYRSQHYQWWGVQTWYDATTAHPIFDGIVTPPARIYHKVDFSRVVDNDHAWFWDFSGTLTILGWMGDDAYGTDGQGIAVEQMDNSRHIYLSSHGPTFYSNFDDWSAESIQLFINSALWAARPVGDAVFATWDTVTDGEWNLDVQPQVGLWYEDRTIPVGIKNVGSVSGTEEVTLYLDGVVEGSESVHLASGGMATVTFTVSKFDVGTYAAQVKHLPGTLIVRPPRIDLQAYEFDSDVGLAGADIYGWYRTYAGPGWYTQWSNQYGGLGHSQHAQPVGDFDEDGVNEVIVGGYENFPDWGRAHILSYDAASGMYVEEHSWFVPGGSYHSPSGSSVLDLDEDGDLEFVVSWTYSGADGIYAYDWDGTTLTELDYFPAAFVFDIYSADYDDDGHLEVLIANAPWGGSPYHVAALAWDAAAGKFVMETSWRSPIGYWWEAPMVWSGNTDEDPETEVAVVISSGSGATAGTWVLDWDGTQWQPTLVYNALIGGGTHYGVVVGDVDGDGTDEIGVGNNRAGYMGAAAALFEWDGSGYAKVWEDSWAGDEVVIEALAIGDADNDGVNEFLVGGGDVHVISWTGSDYAEEATIKQTEGLLAGTVIGDFDSDGLNEVKSNDIIVGPGIEWFFDFTTEPIPLPGLYFDFFGTTDASGHLSFDSAASVIDGSFFVYMGEKSEAGFQYLLEQYHLLDDDVSINYAPARATEAVITSKPNAKALELFPHMAVTWLQFDDVPVIWPYISQKADPGEIVVTPETYTFRHMLNVVDPYASWWYYFMAPDRVADLSGGQKYVYSFGGPIQGYISVEQTDDQATISWNALDNYGHQITGISAMEVSWLGAETETYVPIAITPTLLGDIEVQVGQTVTYYPLIALYGKSNNLLVSGYVYWYQKLVYTTVGDVVKTATLSFVSGPYGDPNAKMAVTVIQG